MTEFLYSVVTAPGLDPHTAEGKPTLPPLEHSVEEIDSLCIERNIAIPLRDGTRIYSISTVPLGPTKICPFCSHGAPTVSTIRKITYGRPQTSNQAGFQNSLDSKLLTQSFGVEMVTPSSMLILVECGIPRGTAFITAHRRQTTYTTRLSGWLRKVGPMDA